MKWQVCASQQKNQLLKVPIHHVHQQVKNRPSETRIRQKQIARANRALMIKLKFKIGKMSESKEVTSVYVSRVEDLHFRILLEQFEGAYREADKTLITIASGFLAASVALIRSQGYNELSSNKIFMQIGLAMFVFCIVLVLTSFKAEQNHKSCLISTRNYDDPEAKCWQKLLRAANNFALFAFIVGIFSVLISLTI